MRLVFLGTPAFAVPTLERLVEAGHQVLAVVTQPDRPRGRGQHPSPPPVKEAAARMGLPVRQPERVRLPEAVEFLRTLQAEVMVVVGYGQIIPQIVIDLAPLGIINVHASLLPAYRGGGPIQWALLNGETRTGVTTMRIDAGLDTGDMLLKRSTEIGPDENAVELGARLAAMGADLLVETLAGLSAGAIVPQKQDSSQATYARLLKKEDGIVDWGLPAQAIHNRVRGLQPWPGACTTFRGQPLHIWKSRLVPERVHTSVDTADTSVRATGPGHLVSAKPLVVSCGSGALELIEVQLEGRKRISAADFANGQRLTENEVLGEPRL
jgi:methionyl-tRNA formyltransferase